MPGPAAATRRTARRAATRDELCDATAATRAVRPDHRATASGWPTPTCSSRSTDDLSRGPHAGDEAVFGGGKVIRESMGQSRATRAEGAPDLVITGAVVLDHWGVVKADIGVRDGRIVGVGKAGNPDTMDGVDPDLVIGPSTESSPATARSSPPGAIDCHVHLICPQISTRRSARGITTIIGGGTGPAEGTKATTVTPGAWNLARMLEALDALPVNVALLGKGNTVSSEALCEQLRGGRRRLQAARGLGHDARRRSTPACGSRDAAGVQVAHPHRHAQRGRLRRGDARARSPAGRSTPTTPRAPAAGTRRTSSRSPRTRTCCRRRPTRPGRTRSTRSPSTSTC